ncbi:MAG TPA: hypothetical protein DCY23_05710 [Ruminococcaceae bacterium]|nr:hypothetical protein [Oscillospiraceae bacterium]
MLLTKTQKKILEIVREYGGMKAQMLKRLCPEAYSFEVSLHQLEVNRKLIKTGEYYCDDTALICDRNTETAFEVMLAVCGHPPEIYCRGQPPFSLTFFKEREQKLCRYDICVVTDGREQVVNAMLGGMAGKYGTAIFVLEQKEQAERMIVPPDCRFAVKENAKYIFYGGC